MLLGTEDDTTSCSEEETILTPTTDASASWGGTGSSWFFQGSLLDQSWTDYGPCSAPALAVHHGRLWSLWTGGRQRASLFWTSLDSSGKWNQPQEAVVPWRVF